MHLIAAIWIVAASEGAFGAASYTTVQSGAFDDEAFCLSMLATSRQSENSPGVALSSRTRHGGIVVRCTQRTIEIRTTATVPLEKIGAKWLERQFAQWNEDQCSDDLVREAIERGWSISAVIMAPDGKSESFDANCD